MRSHIHLPMTEYDGDLLAYVEVSLRNQNGTAATPRVYSGPEETATEYSWPVVFSPAKIDLWIDTPGRYDLAISGPGGFSVVLPGIDFSPGSPEHVITKDQGLRVDNAPEVGKWLVGDFEAGSARWQHPNLTPPHDHDGSTTNSTQVGLVDTDTSHTRLGFGATGETTLGPNSTSGPNGTVVGSSSQAPEQGVTLGDTNGSGAPTAAVRFPFGSGGAQNGQVDPSQTVLRSLVVGTTPQVGVTYPVPGALPTGVTSPVWVRANARAENLRADGPVRHVGSTLGFYGGPAVTRPTRPSGATGALASLLDALQAYGLIQP